MSDDLRAALLRFWHIPTGCLATVISCPNENDRSWHFSDLANENSVGLLCGVKRT
jgi:hypothetical protein